MGDLHLVLPALNLSTLNAVILIMVQVIQCRMVDSISVMIVVSSTGQSPSKFLIIGLRLARILEFEGKRTPSLETRRMSLVTSLDCDLSLMGLTLSTPGLINVSSTKFIRRIYTSIGTLVIVKLLLNRNLTYLEFKKGLLAS